MSVDGPTPNETKDAFDLADVERDLVNIEEFLRMDKLAFNGGLSTERQKEIYNEVRAKIQEQISNFIDNPKRMGTIGAEEQNLLQQNQDERGRLAEQQAQRQQRRKQQQEKIMEQQQITTDWVPREQQNNPPQQRSHVTTKQAAQQQQQPQPQDVEEVSNENYGYPSTEPEHANSNNNINSNDQGDYYNQQQDQNYYYYNNDEYQQQYEEGGYAAPPQYLPQSTDYNYYNYPEGEQNQQQLQPEQEQYQQNHDYYYDNYNNNGAEYDYHHHQQQQYYQQNYYDDNNFYNEGEYNQYAEWQWQQQQQQQYYEQQGQQEGEAHLAADGHQYQTDPGMSPTGNQRVSMPATTPNMMRHFSMDDGSRKLPPHSNTTPNPLKRPASAPRDRPKTATVPNPPKLTQPKSRISKEEVKKKVEEELKKECTFKPQINNYTSAKYSGLTREERIRQLAQDRAAELKRRAEEKKRKEEEELSKYTFQPNTDKKKPRKPVDIKALDERLHHEADKRIELREKAKREQEQQKMQEWFTPQINDQHRSFHQNHSINISAISPNYRPIHERVGELQRKKNEQIHRLRMEFEAQNPDLRFTPQIDSNSERIARTRSLDNSIATSGEAYERLCNELTKSMDKKFRKQIEHSHQLAEEFTFTPQVNPNSERIVQQSDLFAGSNRDFLERQQVYNERTKKKREMLEHEIMEKSRERKECRFHPEIGHNSQLIAEANESFMDRIHRLTVKDRERSEALKQSIMESYYSQFTYKPEINKISKTIGRPSTVDDLASTERNKRIKECIKEELENKFRQEHTFHPTLIASAKTPENSKYRLDPTHVDNLEHNIQELQKERERKIEKAKRSIEYQQMKDCTFAPQVNHTRPKQPSGPIVVRGLGRFLERVDCAKKLAEEQKEREQKAFKVNVSGTDFDKRSVPYTIPKPFNLHQSYKGELKKAKLVQELRQKELEECTFHPQTNSASTREIIDRILSDDDESTDY